MTNRMRDGPGGRIHSISASVGAAFSGNKRVLTVEIFAEWPRLERIMALKAQLRAKIVPNNWPA
jgi:hypothetical protein